MSATDGVKPETPLAKKYQPTPNERAAVAAITARRKARSPVPKLSVSGKGSAVEVGFDHPDSSTAWLLLVNALGSVGFEFADGLISQLLNAGTQGQNYDGKGPNFMLSVITGIAPRDEAECMLAAQMAAVHMATMTFARRLAHADNLAQQDANERAFNKLARTYAAQLEALKRYRTGGEQRVTIRHVTVNEGGQAIVGAVSQAPTGTGGCGKREASP